MQNKREQTIDGVTYEKSEPVELGLCTGCAAYNDSSLCEELSRDCKGVIWLEKVAKVNMTEEPKYTVEEVLEAVDIIFDGVVESLIYIREVKEQLRKNNPEYQQYLELKTKFGE